MRTLYIIYQLCIAAPLILLSTVLTAIVTIIGSLIGGAHFWGYWPARYWSRAICAVLLLPVRRRGMENIDPDKSYVFVANHQGAFDIFLIYAMLDRNFKWMMKKSLRNAPLIGKACQEAGHIFVDNSGPQKTRQTLEQAKDILQGGTSLVVFPEGRRTMDGFMGPYKKGAYQLAAGIGLEVVPMTINGSFDILPRYKGINFVSRHTLELVIHKPIAIEDSENLSPAIEASRKAINSALSPEKQDRPQ